MRLIEQVGLTRTQLISGMKEKLDSTTSISSPWPKSSRIVVCLVSAVVSLASPLHFLFVAVRTGLSDTLCVLARFLDEYLNYAEKNRAEWELKGKEIVAEMVEKVTKEPKNPFAI